MIIQSAVRASRSFLQNFGYPSRFLLPHVAYSDSSRASPGVPYKENLSSTNPSKKVSLPEEVDVVVIGGGVIGCSTLYHLAKLGITNAVLLEKHALTSGTTWHTAGLVWHLRPTDTEVELLDCSWKLMKSLESETGVATGYIQNGGLFIASNKERLDEYKKLGTLGKVYGCESHVLSPADTKKLYPLMNVSDMYGSLYTPEDGTIDPAGYCTALSRGATQMGARVIEGVSVREVKAMVDDFGVKRVSGVTTDRGMIKTKAVVNACGAWSRQLAATVGVKVPLCAMKHAYIVTERIEGIQNMPNTRDHDASVYLRLQGDALSIGGYEPNPIFWDKPVEDFAFSLFELDWDVFSVHIEGAINRIPVVETTGIKSTVCGPESFTPDHKPLMGESPEVRGFYLNCGFNSGGMMMSGGCGRELAKWIVQGKPDLDMFGYDVKRFTEALTDNNQWIRERSHESYAKNYSVVYKNDEPLASRNMIKDVLHQTLLEKGCIYQERQGFERPGWYSSVVSPVQKYDYYGYYDIPKNSERNYVEALAKDYTFDFPEHHEKIKQECLTCRNAAALFNMSYFGKMYLIGPDAPKASDWLFSANVRRPIGQTIYTCLLNKSGGTEADLTVSVINANGLGKPHSPVFEGGEHGLAYYLAIGGAISQHVKSYIQKQIEVNKFKCSLVDESNSMVLLSLQGPKSRDILQSLVNTDLSNDNFPFSSHQEVEVAGEPCRAMRLSFVGEMGWELHIPNESAEKVYREIMRAGEKYGVCNSGYRAIDSLSIEKGYRHWHADLRSDDTPLEAGLAFTCKFKSEIDFLGREALLIQKEKGLMKRIGLFSVDENILLNGLEAIYRNGLIVGFIRRADYAFTAGKSIGYGYVTSKNGEPVTLDFLKSGTYEIERMGQVFPAHYHPKSLFDPENKRVKGFYE